MTLGLWQVRWESGPEGPYRVGTADPAGERPARASSAADPVTVLVLPGRGDSLELRARVAKGLIRHGVQVVMVEHVGQGASPGLGVRPDAVHIDDFDTHAAAALAEADRLDGPVVLLAHSMGGLVAAHVMAARPDRFASAVITSPMWGFASVLPLPVTRLLADLAGRAGKAAELAAGERPFDVESCLRMRGAAGDQAPELREHARRHPDLVRGGSTWGWVRLLPRRCSSSVAFHWTGCGARSPW
jgi:lysophospholipase